MKRTAVLMLALCVAVAVAACACGERTYGFAAMDPETKAECEEMQAMLEDLSGNVMSMSDWTTAHLAAGPSLADQEKSELGEFIGEWSRLWNESRDCLVFFTAANDVYERFDTEKALAQACADSLDAFPGVADSFITERAPTKAEYDAWMSSTSAVLELGMELYSNELPSITLPPTSP